VGCAGILATCVERSSLTVALAALSPSSTPSSHQSNRTATIQQQATVTAIPSLSATTAKPTPTKAPTKPPVPTKTACANPCNPWGYDFSPGSYITNRPSTFCSYFACIANFWNGASYVMECQDAMYSKSGGKSGSCSSHGGNWRPLYSH
jgi:hypothetical protein